MVHAYRPASPLRKAAAAGNSSSFRSAGLTAPLEPRPATATSGLEQHSGSPRAAAGSPTVDSVSGRSLTSAGASYVIETAELPHAGLSIMRPARQCSNTTLLPFQSLRQELPLEVSQDDVGNGSTTPPVGGLGAGGESMTVSATSPSVAASRSTRSGASSAPVPGPAFVAATACWPRQSCVGIVGIATDGGGGTTTPQRAHGLAQKSWPSPRPAQPPPLEVSRRPQVPALRLPLHRHE